MKRPSCGRILDTCDRQYKNMDNLVPPESTLKAFEKLQKKKSYPQPIEIFNVGNRKTAAMPTLFHNSHSARHIFFRLVGLLSTQSSIESHTVVKSLGLGVVMY